MTTEDYLELLDWTGRQIRFGKHGAIPGELAPILDRLNVIDATWIESIIDFRKWLRRETKRRAVAV